MSEQKQNLSAFIDDAIETEEIDSICRTDMGDTAVHYHLIGDAMRGELSELSMLDVSHQVREAITQEQALHVTQATAEKKPGIFASLFDFTGDVSGWLRPAGGLAVAASVAMVVVVSLQQGDVDTGVPAQLVATQDASPVKANVVAVQPATAQQIEAVSTVATTNNAELDRYLDEHSEFAARDTMQGRLPYVRAVGYKSR